MVTPKDIVFFITLSFSFLLQLKFELATFIASLWVLCCFANLNKQFSWRKSGGKQLFTTLSLSASRKIPSILEQRTYIKNSSLKLKQNFQYQKHIFRLLLLCLFLNLSVCGLHGGQCFCGTCPNISAWGAGRFTCGHRPGWAASPRTVRRPRFRERTQQLCDRWRIYRWKRYCG